MNETERELYNLNRRLLAQRKLAAVIAQDDRAYELLVQSFRRVNSQFGACVGKIHELMKLLGEYGIKYEVNT